MLLVFLLPLLSPFVRHSHLLYLILVLHLDLADVNHMRWRDACSHTSKTGLKCLLAHCRLQYSRSSVYVVSC